MLIIQCDSGHLYGDLIACARYRVDDEREKALLLRKSDYGVTHVLFIVHLPRKELETRKSGSSFVGFQGGAWISAHIDDIRQPAEEELTLDEARSAPINELFYNMTFVSSRSSIPSKTLTTSSEGMKLSLEEQKNEDEQMDIEDSTENTKEEVSVLDALAMETENENNSFDPSLTFQGEQVESLIIFFF